MDYERPKWQTDFEAFLGIKTTFILAGNIHDMQLDYDYAQKTCYPLSMEEYLYAFLHDRLGYSSVVFYNRLDSFHNRINPKMAESFVASHFEMDKDSGAYSYSFVDAAAVMRNALSAQDEPVAIIFDMVTSALRRPVEIEDFEREAFANLLLASKERCSIVDRETGKEFTNTLVLVADKVNDIPSWFYVSNPFVKTLVVAKPSRSQRLSYIRQQSRTSFFDFEMFSEHDGEKFCSELCNLTEGMCCTELMGFLDKCRRNDGTSCADMKKAVNSFRYGQSENNWENVTKETIDVAEEIMRRRIKGQDQAIAKAISILYRAASGMSFSSSATSTKPKGVLFLAGPTGTGKTELAKAITEALFTDETQMIRFDMSEFGKSQSDQRLFGAPPGYVGYESGGELTNAVREKPFSLLLFDEIEKADSSIFDKFLQVLDEGRLTDSHGETVYFGQTLIVFTSNYGLSEKDVFTNKNTNVITSSTYDSYEELRSAVEDNIRNPLKSIFRPEFINRIGENFVVFDFISEEVAQEILRSKLASFARRLKADRNINLYIAWELLDQLMMYVKGNLEMGGRGVVNVLEERFLNPLSKTLFCCDIENGADMLLRCGDAVNAGRIAFELRQPECSEGFSLIDEVAQKPIEGGAA